MWAPYMDHRADNFFQLAEHLLETYLGATRDVLTTKDALDKSDIDRIIAIMQEYTPKLRHVFNNLCQNCPAHRIARHITPETTALEDNEIIAFARDSLTFSGFLLSQYEPANSMMWLLDLRLVIADYADLSRGGQRVLDQRVKRALEEKSGLYSAMLYLGGGGFTFVFIDADSEAGRRRADAIIDHVLKLTGRDGHAQTHPTRNGAGPQEKASTGSPTEDVKSGEADLLKRLRDRFDAAVGGLAETQSKRTGEEPAFASIRSQFSLTFVPIWDARTSAVSMALVWPRRHFPDGSRMAGYGLLSRGRHDPFHNDLQAQLLADAIEAVQRQATTAVQTKLCPPAIVGFSLAGLVCADLEALEARIGDALAGYAGGKIILWLQEIDEHIPYRSLTRLLGFLQKSGLSWITDLPLKHPYWSVCQEGGLPILVRDVERITALGLDEDSALQLARHICKKIQAQGRDCLMLNLQTSPWAEAVLRGGGRYLSGRLIGEATLDPGLIRELPSARVLMKV